MAYAKPTEVVLSGHSGIYGGARVMVRGNSSYPYIYVGGASTNWRYWLKGTLNSIGQDIIDFEADSSVTSGYKEFQVILSSTKLTDGQTLGGDADSKVYYFRCPAIAALIYTGDSFYTVCDCYNDSNFSSIVEKSGWWWSERVLLRFQKVGSHQVSRSSAGWISMPVIKAVWQGGAG